MVFWTKNRAFVRHVDTWFLFFIRFFFVILHLCRLENNFVIAVTQR